MAEVFRSAFRNAEDAASGLGKRPVIFDILAPDRSTSILPDDLKLVLHTNPSSMKISYTKIVERIQTRGGWVEQHWGDATQSISFELTTGGFMRLYSGLSHITNPAYGGTRRETIAYDKYLDLLALFYNNGTVWDERGDPVFQGIIKCTFDEGVYLGWFDSFSVQESAEKPYQFSISAGFTVDREVLTFRSTVGLTDPTNANLATGG